MSATEFNISPASIDDIVAIQSLYQKVYDGQYPDPTVTNYFKLKEVMESGYWHVYIAKAQAEIVGVVTILYDSNHLVAKAQGGVVHPDFRGHDLTQKLMLFGIQEIERSQGPIDLVYVTTRTVHLAAQVLTQHMGFKKLGVFPNVHKTSEYETHGLAVLYRNDCLSKRHSEFILHPLIAPFYQLAQKECGLESLVMEEEWDKKHYDKQVEELEVIKAKKFIAYRYQELVKNEEMDFAFYPFLTPNLLISNPSQTIEIYCYVNESDGHSVIMGCKVGREVAFDKVLRAVSEHLRDLGMRYIEMIIRAHRRNIIERLHRAKFIPSGYFPALQKEGDQRFDYVVFTRSFEILDFEHVQVNGHYKDFLKLYLKAWEETNLANYLEGRNE